MVNIEHRFVQIEEFGFKIKTLLRLFSFHLLIFILKYNNYRYF